MHFNVRFTSDDTYEKNFSYGLVFVPTPVWIKGSQKLIIINNGGPKYKKGGVIQLIKEEKLDKYLVSKNPRAIISIDKIGHGNTKDLNVLIDDLTDNGITISFECLEEVIN